MHIEVEIRGWKNLELEDLDSFKLETLEVGDSRSFLNFYLSFSTLYFQASFWAFK